MLMQAMVDHLGRFMDVYIGWPGKVHDARVFVNSNLYRKAVAGSLFPDWKRRLNGVEVILCLFFIKFLCYCRIILGSIGYLG